MKANSCCCLLPLVIDHACSLQRKGITLLCPKDLFVGSIQKNSPAQCARRPDCQDNSPPNIHSKRRIPRIILGNIKKSEHLYGLRESLHITYLTHPTPGRTGTLSPPPFLWENGQTTPAAHLPTRKTVPPRKALILHSCTAPHCTKIVFFAPSSTSKKMKKPYTLVLLHIKSESGCDEI